VICKRPISPYPGMVDVPKHGTVQVDGSSLIAAWRDQPRKRRLIERRTQGPAGSSYAPSLVDSLKSLSYGDFVSTVVAGKKEVNTAQEQVMPSFGTNRNVMCYIDAIYVYLRARSDGVLSRQRPEKHEPRTNAYTKAEDSCMG
jgi:hypothetical protein